jgi:hypothetical protein
MKAITMLASMLVGGAVFAPAASVAEQGSKPLHCLTTTSIASTDVKDDRTIIFRTRSGKYYRNQLPFACPRLGFEKAFSYRLTNNQLCNVDIIHVLERGGPGLMQGASCGLGMFEPIDKATAMAKVKPAK